MSHKANVESLLNDQVASGKTLIAARDAWSKIPLPEAFTVPGLKEIYNERYQLNDSNSLQIATLIAGDIVKIELNKNKDQKSLDAAWDVVLKGVDYAQRLGPSPKAIQSLEQQLSSSRSSIEQQLKQMLELDTEAEVRRAISRYRQNLDDLKSAAMLRQQTLSRLLRNACDAGLASKVWKSLLESMAPFDQGDALFETDLTGVLAQHIKEIDDPDVIKQFRERFKQKGIVIPEYWRTARMLKRLSEKDDLTDAYNSYPKTGLTKLEQRQLAVETACHIAKNGNFDKAIDWINRHREDLILREQALHLVSGMLLNPGNAKAMLKKIEKSYFSSIEKGASQLGMLQKLTVLPQN